MRMAGGPEFAYADHVSSNDNRPRFANLIMPHLSEAYGPARALTGNRADAEDVIQDACVRAFCAIAKVAEGSARRTGAVFGARLAARSSYQRIVESLKWRMHRAHAGPCVELGQK